MSSPELVGNVYTDQLDLEPGDQFVFKLSRVHRQADKHQLLEQRIGTNSTYLPGRMVQAWLFPSGPPS